MLPFAISHVSVPRLGYGESMRLADCLGCMGVELGNGPGRPLLDGDDAATARDAATTRGLTIVGLSPVHPYKRMVQHRPPRASRARRQREGLRCRNHQPDSTHRRSVTDAFAHNRSST